MPFQLKIGKLCRTVPDECLQFWGAQGYLHKSFISRMYRDLRVVPIGGGADEVILGILTKLEGM